MGHGVCTDLGQGQDRECIGRMQQSDPWSVEGQDANGDLDGHRRGESQSPLQPCVGEQGNHDQRQNDDRENPLPQHAVEDGRNRRFAKDGPVRSRLDHQER